YREAIDMFCRRHDDLYEYRLGFHDWESIQLVMTWLKSFRSATTQMSATQTPMLSSTHAIFRGLQDDLRDILHELPDLTSPALKQGLLASHRKLSDYYYKFDESPFYVWASCKYICNGQCTKTNELLL
ncbi:hypothetical protein C8J56DRAFT_785909, partial [Mycena floridula]